MDQEITRSDDDNLGQDRLAQVLARLSTEQLRFVAARQNFATDKEAAKHVGIKPDTVYQWKHKGIPIDDAVKLICLDGILAGRKLLERAFVDAVQVKIEGLTNKRWSVRSACSSEIMDRVDGKPVQRQELGGPGGAEVAIRVIGGLTLEDLQ